MDFFNLSDAIKEQYNRAGGGYSYTLYYDGKPVLYRGKPLRIFDRKSRLTVEPKFFTLSTMPNNPAHMIKDFIEDDDEMLRRIFGTLQTNVIEFRYGRDKSRRYSFNSFISGRHWENKYDITILNSPRIIWINSPIYTYLTTTLSQSFSGALARDPDFDDDAHKIRGENEFQIFVDTLRCMLYENYISFVKTKAFTNAFKRKDKFFFYSMFNTFSILSVRYVGAGLTIFNPIFDDKEIFTRLKECRAYEKFFLIPKEDRASEYADERDMMLEEEVGDFRVLFMDNLSISLMLGLKNKFNFTQYTAAVFFMGNFVTNRFSDLMPEFANSRTTVYLLMDASRIELGYSDYIDEEEYKTLRDSEKMFYQKGNAIQMFISKEWATFKMLGFSNLNRVLSACEVNIR